MEDTPGPAGWLWFHTASLVTQAPGDGVRAAWSTAKMAALEVAERIYPPHMDYYVIHEVYDGDFSQEQFEAELDAALERQYQYIVIEPARLGDETARWISVGNCLHRTSVVTGIVCLLTPLGLTSSTAHYLGLPAGALSVVCAALYGVSWQSDPCCHYQVDLSGQELALLPPGTLRTSSPIVLVRKEDTHRKRLHNFIALTALVYCAQKVFDLCTDW